MTDVPLPTFPAFLCGVYASRDPGIDRQLFYILPPLIMFPLVHAFLIPY